MATTYAAAPSRWILGRDRRSDLIAMGVGTAAFVVLADDEGTILCPFRRCTGGYCPLCGGTRAGARLLRLDFAGAWAAHPLVVFLVAQIPLLVLARVLVGSFTRAITNRVLMANAALALCVWAGRLWDGSIPRPTELRLPF